MAFRPVVKRVPLINRESYRRQTRVQRAITIGDSTFTPEISVTPTDRTLTAYFVSFHWLLSGDESKLYNTFEAYRSNRIDWIEFLEVELTVTLDQKDASQGGIHVDLFRNALAEDESIYLAATKEERAFLKFLGRDSLCMIVRYILDVFKLDPSTLITLWPEGTHRTNAEHKNLLKYYHSLGFAGTGRTLAAPASRFLQHCHNLP